MTLDELRRAIDAIDDELLELLNRRIEVVQKVGELKHKTGSAIYRPEREKAIIERLVANNRGPLTPAAIEAIFVEIFAVARNFEQPQRVAYLGPEGSFTHQAAENRFGAMSEYIPLHSIPAVFKAVHADRAKFAVVPIENNTNGFVGETLDELAKTDLKIVAELYMPIHHSFVSKAQHLQQIKRIYSKDIAFNQCRNFLLDHDLDSIEYIPVESTAKAARLAAEDTESAAICSHIAAKLYHVPIMFENIEDNHRNQTRFIILSDFENAPSGRDKTSILAKLSDRPGSLYEFLQSFHEAKVNLKKIESRPATEQSGFDYWFYIDFEGHREEPHIKALFEKHKEEIKYLGSYVQNG
ncbi:prephenate dehydratase [Hydrogenimonas sp. SS33]|uniref:prephenate dehydratase n=1 Tax=Hydrogenimonas leucolamina TaxID=2954236 RepID=UPI00336BF72E